jgi:hypothetical protein
MSLETWKREFYPIPASKAKRKDGELVLIEHSLRKWRGLRKKALRKHGLEMNFNVIREKEAVYHALRIDSTTCSLCKVYGGQGSVSEGPPPCDDCPLSVLLGKRCDETNALDDAGSPYIKWIDLGDPEPMIKALERCRRNAKKEGRR